MIIPAFALPPTACADRSSSRAAVRDPAALRKYVASRMASTTPLRATAAAGVADGAAGARMTCPVGHSWPVPDGIKGRATAMPLCPLCQRRCRLLRSNSPLGTVMSQPPTVQVFLAD